MSLLTPPPFFFFQVPAAALIIHTDFGVCSEGRGNQCRFVHRLVDTGPVTGASPVRNANTVRPDAR